MWPSIGTIPTYGILYFTGIVVHFWLSRRIARRLGLETRVWVVVSICYFLGMVVGAKALYDVRFSRFDLTALVSPDHYMQGGLWGGLLVYLVLAVPLAALLTRQRLSALDLVALTIPIPWMLAKLGCLLNGCCHGRACSLPWAITFPEHSREAPAGIPLHPTQIYEILVVAAVLVVFKTLNPDRWRGTMLLWFFVVYGLGRAAVDVFRGDTDQSVYVGPVTVTQLVCAGAGIVAAALIIGWRYGVGRRLPIA